jgi:hypothetical protein
VTPVDPENAVVQLCVAGVRAEQNGDGSHAGELYSQAWGARTNDLEASIAAHYVARAQPDPEARETPTDRRGVAAPQPRPRGQPWWAPRA